MRRPATGSAAGRAPALRSRDDVQDPGHSGGQQFSDERTEFLINDRLSFMRFLGLGLADRVPDARTIWLFREKLTRAGAIKRLFAASMPRCEAPASSPCPGRSSTPASWPRQAAQHRGGEEGDQGGSHPPGLGGQAGQAAAEGPRRALDGQVHQGQAATDGSSRRSTWPSRLRLPEPCRDRPRLRFHPDLGGNGCRRLRGRPFARRLLDKTNTASDVWADTAYRSAANEEFLDKNGFVSRVHRKKPQGQPMPERTGRANGKIESPLARRACVRRAEIRWGCSSAPSGSPEPRPRSAWPTSSTT